MKLSIRTVNMTLPESSKHRHSDGFCLSFLDKMLMFSICPEGNGFGQFLDMIGDGFDNGFHEQLYCFPAQFTEDAQQNAFASTCADIMYDPMLQGNTSLHKGWQGFAGVAEGTGYIIFSGIKICIWKADL